MIGVMNSKMKGILLLCMALLFAGEAFSIHKEFVEGYEIVSSKVNTPQQERPMSFYKDGKVVINF